MVPVVSKGQPSHHKHVVKEHPRRLGLKKKVTHRTISIPSTGIHPFGREAQGSKTYGGQIVDVTTAQSFVRLKCSLRRSSK